MDKMEELKKLKKLKKGFSWMGSIAIVGVREMESMRCVCAVHILR